MTNSKNKNYVFSNPRLQLAGVLILICLAAALLWFHTVTNNQAMSALVAQVRFFGEYRIGDGPWEPIEEGKHIPATQGDVTLRGNFHMYAPDGEYVGIYDGDLPIALFINHINLTFYEGDYGPVVLDYENPIYGDSGCGVIWAAYRFETGREEPIEIRIHNPHRYGNGSAIDELLSNVALWSGIDFERSILESSQTERNVGLFFMIVSFVMLGSALFSTLLHLPSHKTIWLLGLAVMAAGVYMTYSDTGVSFWSEIISINTSLLGLSMMLYMLFVLAIATRFLKKAKLAGYIATTMVGVADGICFLLPMLTNLYFYDCWTLWVVAQSIANLILIVCLILEWKSSNKKERRSSSSFAR